MKTFATRSRHRSRVVRGSVAGTRTIGRAPRDHDYDAPAPGSYTLPVIKPAADGALLDSNGQTGPPRANSRAAASR